MDSQEPSNRADSEPIQLLLAQALEILDEVGQEGFEELCRAHGDFESELRARVDALRRIGLAGGAPPSTETEREFPDRLGGFELLERLGAGGMGVVYRARQESIGREVALKLVRPELLYFPGVRERFLREVRAVGGMQHHGIVPVYAVGEDEGIPWFAMQLIEGASLADVLASVRSYSPAELAPTEFADVLTLLIPGPQAGTVDSAMWHGSLEEITFRIGREVAEALEHAHRRGILHRDVKPSNIMVTAEGSVLLLDFGLASSKGAEAITRSQATLGSLPYMAPEQVEGRNDDLDRRCDVYGLGATLYEVATLTRAFPAEGELELRAEILEGRPRPPRSLHPQLSRDAEAILLTAMDRDRERRYASAADLARDLTNVLEHRPIEARPAGSLVRLRRWVRRRPATAVASALGVVVVVGGPSLFAWHLSGVNRMERVKNDALSEAYLEVRGQMDRAEANLEDAFKAVDRLLTEIGDERLLEVPGMQSIRLGLLEEAIVFIEGFLDQRSDDPRMQLEYGLAHGRLGKAQLLLGRRSEGRENLRTGIDRLAQLRVEQPQLEMRQELARFRTRLGWMLVEEGELEQASVVLHEGILELEADIEDGSVRERYLPGWLAIMLLELGNVKRIEGDSISAVEVLNRAFEIIEEQRAAEPSDQDHTLNLNRVLTQLGMAYADQGLRDDAGFAFEYALDVARELVQVTPLPSTRQRLFLALNNYAGMVPAERRLELRKQAYDVAEALQSEFPALPAHSYQLGMAQLNLGAELAYRKPNDARTWLEGSVRTLSQYVERFPTMLAGESILARALADLGMLCWLHGTPEEMRTHLHAALERLRRLHKEGPGYDPGGETLARVLYILALDRFDAGFEFESRSLLSELPATPIGHLYRGAFELRSAALREAGSTREASIRSAAESLRSEAFESLGVAIEAGLDPRQFELGFELEQELASDPRFLPLLQSLDAGQGE